MPVDNVIASDVWARYQYLRDNGHLHFVQKAQRCEDFFEGLQWDKADLALLKAARRPAMTINKIISTMANVMGEQIFNRTDIAFRPRNEGATTEVADALTKVFMQISDNNQLPWARSDVFADGIISSRGFFDVRLDTTDSLRGEVRIEQLNPKNVLIDADADEYDPDKWSDVIVTKWLSADQIELLYSKKDAELLRNRGDSFYPYAYDSIDRERDRFGAPRSVHFGLGPETMRTSARNIRVIERQWRKLDRVDHFVDIMTGDMRVVPGSWSEEQIASYLANNPNLTITKKLIHRIRWTVVADNVVLKDEWSPYKHFTVIPYFPFFRRGRTMGLVENLIGPQEMFNKIRSQELHVVNTTANSGWEVESGTLMNMSVGELENRGAQSGLVLEVKKLGESVAKIQPNQVPTGLDRLSYKAEEDIKAISGVSDYMQGFAREDVSAKSVNANKQSGQANLAKVMDNMNRTDYILARNTLDLIQEFMTEERLITITTDKLTAQVERMKVNEVSPEGIIVNDLTIGEYAVIVTNQPERDTFEDTQFDHAVRLRTEVGVQIPDKWIIKSSRLKDKGEIIAELDGNQDSPEARAQAALQARAQEAEVAKTEAEVAKIQKEANAPEEDGTTELIKIQQEAAIKREQMQLDHELALEKLAMEMELKERQLMMETAIKDKVATAQAAAARITAAKTPATPGTPAPKKKP